MYTRVLESRAMCLYLEEIRVHVKMGEHAQVESRDQSVWTSMHAAGARERVLTTGQRQGEEKQTEESEVSSPLSDMAVRSMLQGLLCAEWRITCPPSLSPLP